MKRVGLALGLLFVLRVGAQPLPRKDVPAPLVPWIPWALDGAEDKLCPLVDGSAVCLWPGRLQLTVEPLSARFAQEMVADRALWAPLPGSVSLWPQEVRLNGHPVPVVEREGGPATWLVAGTHRLEGKLLYRKIPDSLRVPQKTGLVDLTLRGQPVPFPKREEDGTLLLALQAGEATGADELRLKVFRKVEDGIPIRVETRLLVEVAGKAREVRLHGSLLPGAAAVSVSGELPARLDGRELRVQVRPGKFQLAVTCRPQGNPAELKPEPPVAPWPEQEVWVFRAAEKLRQTDLGGAGAIDTSRTEVPDDWKQLPAFLVEKGGSLTIKEVRRGEPDPPPDQISLRRSLWLDLDGAAFTAQDSFSGTLGRTTRLDISAPSELGRVSVDGQDQLVTADPGTKRKGVELRSRALAVGADLRMPRGGALAAVGWDVNVQNLGISLNLPPGWRLFSVGGADRSPSTWTSQWTLFSFFFVLLVAVAAGRLFGPVFGGVALAALVLCHRETGAPELIWIALLVLSALLRVVKTGAAVRVLRISWILSFLVLAILAIPFFVKEVRQGIYPQTASKRSLWDWDQQHGAGGAGVSGFVTARRADEPVPKPADQTVAPATPSPASPQSALPKQKVLQNILRSAPESKAESTKDEAQRASSYEQDPHAVVQTGPGVPRWHWASHEIGWSGPVEKGQRVRLWLVPPFVNLFLAFLRVVLVSLLAFGFLRGTSIDLPGPDLAGTFLALLVGAMISSVSLVSYPVMAAEDQEPAAARGSSAATLPDDTLLDALREKLLRPAPCVPSCVTTTNVLLAVEGAQLRITAEVHAAAAGAWTIPGPASAWAPRQVTTGAAGVAGAAVAPGLVRLDDGFLHLRLPAGVHTVTVIGPVPPSDSLTLQFPQHPRRARVDAPGWQVDGVREEGGIEGSVQLTRRLKTTAALAASAGSHEPWVEIQRTFDIGVAWSAETVVRRVTPTGAPLLLKIPLLSGMLATGEQEVKDGQIVVTLGPDQTESRWTSVIKPGPGEGAVLKAAEGKPWSEIWVVRCSPIWQCTAKGIPPVSRAVGSEVVEEYRPWPGESITLSFQKPTGQTGETLTIDGVDLAVSPGRRLTDATLSIAARASRATPLVVTLPAGAEVQSLTVGGQVRPIRPDKGKLTLTVDPGSHPVIVSFRLNEGASVFVKAPRVELGRSAVNIRTSLSIPDDRWLLLAGGPGWGPAILFWGLLLVMLLVAYGLGRIPASPLSSWQWLLLALGLTQIPIVAASIVVLWFLAFAWREKRSIVRPALHDLVQAGLVLWTLTFLGCLYVAVHEGLLLRPDMQVAGNGSTNSVLKWYLDRIAGDTPAVWVLSLPLWVYRIAMLVWSLWLAAKLVRWLPWAFGAFTTGGAWKRSWRRKGRTPPLPSPGPSEIPPAVAQEAGAGPEGSG